MIHGTTDRLLTWCMDEVIAVDGWSMESDSVECIECLRRQGEALREENARLRQRVKELEREKKFAEDNWARAGGRAEAAESAEEGK